MRTKGGRHGRVKTTMSAWCGPFVLAIALVVESRHGCCAIYANGLAPVW